MNDTSIVEDPRPCFRVRAWWDQSLPRSAANPMLRLGTRVPRHTLEQGVQSTPLAFTTPNKEIYLNAALLCRHINQQPLAFRLEWDQQKLYNDIRRAKANHHYQAEYEVREQALSTNFNERLRTRWDQVESESNKITSARDVARSLLQSLNTSYAAQIEHNTCFYFNSDDGRRFIIDPGTRNLIHLAPERPIGLCVYLKDPNVQDNVYDWAIAIYMYLKRSATPILEAANEYHNLRRMSWETATDDTQHQSS